jgi:hypothetical protein
MKLLFNLLFKLSKATIIVLFCFYPIHKTFASYTPVNGRITYLAGVLVDTNFQETLFNNDNIVSKPGRSQSFALLFQALGDLNSQGSLMAESTIGRHKFTKETSAYLDDYTLEGISFDLGYRRHVIGDFWLSTQLGSLYSWRISQRVNSRPTKFSDSEFSSVYSIIVGVQYESQFHGRPVSYDFRIRKYMTGQLDDQMSIGLSVGFRFGSN